MKRREEVTNKRQGGDIKKGSATDHLTLSKVNAITKEKEKEKGKPLLVYLSSGRSISSQHPDDSSQN